MKLGKLLKLYRTSQKISQGELAKRLSVTQNFLSQVENGKKVFSFKKAKEISKLLGMSSGLFTLLTMEVPKEFSKEEKMKLEDLQSKYLVKSLTQ